MMFALAALAGLASLFGLNRLALALVVAAALVGFFFRDPERVISPAPDELVSPADGRVTAVLQVREDRFLHGPATLINIFLSPADVHLNRAPMAGRIAYQEYVPGRYLAAYAPKAGEVNERNYLGIEAGGLRILICQVAGVVARRVVSWVHPGQELSKGERIGMIKFGSLTQLFLPPEIRATVRPGDRVIGGVTVVGRISGEAEDPAHR